jgi:mRNA-degrading endonuclease RelE of RelBE toxin-antitoxin system
MLDVQISKPALNMLESLYEHDRTKIQRTIATLRTEIANPHGAKRLVGYEDTYVTRSGNYRVVFRRSGDNVYIISVSTAGAPIQAA